MEQWAKSITDDYENILKFSKLLKNRIMHNHGLLKEMSSCTCRYNHLHKARLMDGAKQELNRLFDLMDDFKGASLKREKVNVDSDYALQELKKFTNNHVQKVGMEQAVKDFQFGMNLLNKNKKESVIASKRQLKEDGDFGEKTLACFCDACKNYSPRVIKKYIRLGAIANVVFNTKNNSRINTDKLVCTICENLKG